MPTANASAPRRWHCEAQGKAHAVVKPQMDSISYSRGYGKHDNTPQQLQTATWVAFVDAVLSDRATTKGQQWISGAFAIAPDDDSHRAQDSKSRAIGKPHRCKSCAQPRRFVGLDIDEALTAESLTALVDVVREWSSLIYTTASHKPEAPRVRLIVELDAPAPRGDLIAASAVIRNRIDARMVARGFAALTWDTGCDKPEQPLYLPVTTSETWRTEAPPAVLAELLKEAPPPQEKQKPAVAELRIVPPCPGVAGAYLAAALRSASETVASAPEHTRNATLNKEAHGLAGLHELTDAQIVGALEPAAVVAGLDRGEITATLASAISSGRLNPRQIPAPKADTHRADVEGDETYSGAPGASLGEVFAAARASKSSRPVIDIRTGDLPATVDGCEHALIEAGAPIYARGEMLARAVPAPLEPGNVKRTPGALILTAVTIAALQDDLERIADFQRWTTGPNGPEPKRADAPAKACRALLERVGRWRFPQLRGIALAPFVRADGTVACTPGYDRESGLLLAIPSNWPAPPSNPTRADALTALARLRHLIRTFAFVTPEDESVAISAMLSPFVRPAIEAAPMFGFSAPVRGSGKSMLVDMAAILATGHPAAVMTWGTDQDENTKALASALLAGDALVNLDNVETQLRGELLCSASTQSVVRLRPLGRSELVTIPCVATMMATGNALTPAGDMTRRILVAELDPQCERPELREFSNDPKADALAERAELVNAALTIITAGLRADFRRPAPLGSYGQWSRLVRDPLIWLGMPDPITVMERTFDQDPERESAIGILAAWREVYGTGSATAAEAAKAATTHTTLADALESITARAGSVSNKALGCWLRKHDGRVLGGLKVQRAGGTAKHGIRWRVVEHGVSGVSGVFSTASHTEGGDPYRERKTEGPKETPITPETPPTDNPDEWGDVE